MKLATSFTSLGKRYDNSVKLEAVKMYLAGASMDAISVSLRTTKRSVANWIIKSGTTRRDHTQRFNVNRNQAIADQIRNPTPNVAYILGYTMADGSVTEYPHKSPGVSFECKMEDRELLDAIALEFGFGMTEVKSTKQGYAARLRMFGRPIAEAFAEWGIVQRKTFKNCEFPALCETLAPHYIRGVFDGDGCAHYRQNSDRYSCSFLGSERFLIGLRDALVSATGVSATSVLKRPGHWVVAWQSVTAIRKIYDYIYPPGGYIHLARKRNIMQQICEHGSGT